MDDQDQVDYSNDVEPDVAVMAGGEAKDSAVVSKESAAQDELPPECTVFVTRFRSPSNTESAFRDFFSRFGEVKRVLILGKTGYVQFETAEQALSAKEGGHLQAGLDCDSLIVDFKKGGFRNHREKRPLDHHQSFHHQRDSRQRDFHHMPRRGDYDNRREGPPHRGDRRFDGRDPRTDGSDPRQGYNGSNMNGRFGGRSDYPMPPQHPPQFEHDFGGRPPHHRDDMNYDRRRRSRSPPPRGFPGEAGGVGDGGYPAPHDGRGFPGSGGPPGRHPPRDFPPRDMPPRDLPPPRDFPPRDFPSNGGGGGRHFPSRDLPPPRNFPPAPQHHHNSHRDYDQPRDIPPHLQSSSHNRPPDRDNFGPRGYPRDGPRDFDRYEFAPPAPAGHAPHHHSSSHHHHSQPPQHAAPPNRAFAGQARDVDNRFAPTDDFKRQRY